MQAIILAAGMGKRLKGLTRNNTKCMVRVNGVTLIDRMLHQIDRYHLSKIIIVTGYEGKKLTDYIDTMDIETPIIFIHNPVYYKTNNIYSLSLAKKWLCEEDTLLFESDLIFEDAVLDMLISDPRQTLALVDKYESWMDGTCVRLDQEDRMTEFISGRKFDYNNTAGCYKTVNIYKFSRHFSETHYVPFLDAYQKALGQNEYYEQVLRVITMLDDAEIRGKRLDGQRWYEIDDIQDLDIASVIFYSSEESNVAKMEERYGGYWRFPGMLDFCYLVNPYYPPDKLIDEIKASFGRILIQYPSGMQVNSLLAAKNFGVCEDNVLVGNGASELIKALIDRLDGRTGLIRPSFEEYFNRCKADDTVVFVPDNRDFSYTADDITEFFDSKNISNLVLVNPDNPSGNYIPKADVMRLLQWSKERQINLIIDESFADFSTEKNHSFVEQDTLNAFPTLFVMKSISKSYGVPGLRLGILASGSGMIADLKKDVSIWNINSFAEFYMQIAEKYKDDYETALERFRAERERFVTELSKTDNVRILPTQANYIMAELLDGITAKELVKRLLADYKILVKDLSGKLNGENYVRIAIRNTDDNDRLLKALKESIYKIREGRQNET